MRKVNRWKDVLHANGSKKRVRVAIVRKTEYRSKSVTKIKEGNCRIIKWSIHQESISKNMNASNISAPKNMKQIPTYLK
jgi:site-specific recombinase XerC